MCDLRGLLKSRRELSAGKRFCSKVRDRAAFAKATAPKEDALASTRAACAPQNVQRGLVFSRTGTIDNA